MTGKMIRDIVIRILCAVAVFLVIVSFFQLMHLCVGLGSSPDSNSDYGEPEIQKIIERTSFVLFSLAFYSFSAVALRFDLPLKRRFAAGTVRNREILKKTVSSPFFWVELAVVLLMTFVLPDSLLLFYGNYRIAAYPVFAVLFFLAWTSAARRARDEAKTRGLGDRREKDGIGVWDVFIPVGVRALVYVILSLMAAPIGLFFNMIWAVLTLRLIGIPIFVILVLLGPVIYLILYFRAVSIRRKMMKRLTKICDDKGYSLECERPYRSLLFPRAEPEITIRTGKETIECKLLCALSRRTPLYLSPDGEAIVEHRFRLGRRTLLRHLVCTRYAFGEGDKKILLIVPVPRNVYRTLGDDYYSVFSGDRIEDRSFYHMTTFLDALELDTLE